MAVRVVQLGSARHRGEGLRLGTVRRPPRGVKKENYASENWYDVWLPEAAPSQQLVSAAQADSSPKQWEKFERAYRREMSEPQAQRLLALLAALSKQTDFSVGCYCEDENQCHRAILKQLLVEAGAKMA
jgi:uncharacterized protein YeaO (DUF488 family)